MPAISEINRPLAHVQRMLSDTPWEGVKEDYDRIYNRGQIEIGLPHGVKISTSDSVRDNTVVIVGSMFGDEGKGRFVDNKIASLLDAPNVDRVNVVRFQGGNNAGHTIELETGQRVSLHVIPSAIMYEETRGLIDSGVIVHVEDLQTETKYAEGIVGVGDLRGKVLLSNRALLNTDLERAEEILNRQKTNDAGGGTGRGIASTYAHHYDRLGLKIHHLLSPDWRKRLGDRYDMYVKDFAAQGLELATVPVPDFREIKLNDNNVDRTVGTRAEFLDRLESAREWLLERNMTQEMVKLHREIFRDKSQGVLFEGAQGIGLSPWLGSYPDITASDTTGWGILNGSTYWRPDNIAEKIGILKGPYTSSVGSRKLPTQIDLSKEHNELPKNFSSAQERGVYIRREAKEVGTTTKRWRDVAELDLANLSYNAVVGGIESFAVTMMDLSRPGDIIRVSTHYKKDGENVPYEPGMEYMNGLTPQYLELPGWDGAIASQAKSLDDLPINALKYLSLIQARTGVPIVAITASAARDKLITLPGYTR